MASRADSTSTLTLAPIGYVRCELKSRAEAARQPRAAADAVGRIELLADRNFEHALEDLAGWEYLWVIFWFHLNAGWRPKVLPPRSSTGRKGVFATRSPHRPNPLGLSVVRLEAVAGLTLHIRELDMLDGTPVLDIKPYVAYSDARSAAGSGWLEGASATPGGDAPRDPIDRYTVHWEARAGEQARWIEARTGLALRQRVDETLALGPAPHPYRRIRRVGDHHVLAVKEWRLRFTVTDRVLRVFDVASGYRATQLAAGGAGQQALAAHREFAATFAATAPTGAAGTR